MRKKFIILLVILILFPSTFIAQNLKAEKVLHQNILKTVKNDVEENYFDPKFNGVDLEGNYKKAKDLIDKAKSSEEMSDIIARFLLLFNDSHVYFIPPPKTVTVDYGWELSLYDEKAYITKIEEDSDAYKKGIRIGDQLYMIEGFIPTRQDFQVLKYHYEVLRPQASLNILLIKPNGNKYKMTIEAKIIKESVFMPTRRELNLKGQKSYADSTKLSYYQDIEGLTILKMPSFDMTRIKVDKMIDKVRKNDALILDLRDNGGGLVTALDQLVSNLFDKEITLYNIKERKASKRYVSEPRSKTNFAGKLVVLIGNDSASGAEIFARIIQLEKRGIVIGNQSSGAVMQSQIFQHTFGMDSLIPYASSITTADVIMKDDQRLEKVGVTPDEKIVLTAMDLVNQRDPAISRAAEILGFKLTPEQAGKIFIKDK